MVDRRPHGCRPGAPPPWGPAAVPSDSTQTPRGGMLRNAVRYPYLWLVVTALGLAGCGGSSAGSDVATPVPVPPPKRQLPRPPPPRRPPRPGRRPARPRLRRPARARRRPLRARRAPPPPVRRRAVERRPRLRPPRLRPRSRCSRADRWPSARPPAIWPAGSPPRPAIVPSARAVASASRPHQFDPPSSSAAVPSYSAEGYTCVGQRDAGSMLALSDYRCTRGSSVVTFQRS